MPRKSHTPAPLNWLKANRARVAGEISTLEKRASHVAARVLNLERALHEERLRHQLTSSRIEELRANLAAMDSSIVLFDATQDPGAIADIKAWAGKYGKRGAFNAEIQALLRAAAPAYISTTNLYELLAVRFGIVHVSSHERMLWIRHHLRNRLRKLQAAGRIERELQRNANNQNEAAWRWKAEKLPSMAQLRARDVEVRGKKNGDDKP